MKEFISLLIITWLTSVAAVAQNTNTASAYAYKRLNANLQYAFIENKPTTAHPQEGDQVVLRMQSIFNKRLMYSSTQAFKGKPAVYGVSKPSFKGDLIEAIVQMTPGDSIVCLVDAEAMYNFSKVKLPDFLKPGDKIQYFIKLVSIKSKEQVQKEQQEAIMKQMKEQEAKQKAAAAKQLITDDKALRDYFSKKQIMPVKTASGLYYTIQQQGSGELAIPGDSVTMNYTGTLLDGTKFDSNIDTAFQHVQPLQFVLGRGGVIRGWDEGIGYLKSGAKATFYIPSPLAYAQQTRPGSAANPKGIPANSVLLFDVELVAAKHPAPPPGAKMSIDTLGNLITPAIKNNN
jgi:FKBP-type peptidyl-prolyl cis-trans isomerase